jgi:hypothetical protein
VHTICPESTGQVDSERLLYDGEMKPFSELTRRRKLSEVLRWLCVLPTAVLGRIVAQLILGAVVQVAHYGGWNNLGDSRIAYWLGVLLYYVPREMVFVIAGAMMSPRYQKTTATGLAALAVFLSLMTHVVGQHLTRNHVGLVNYTHFVAESAGALGGAAYILLQVWRNRRTEMTT